MAIAPDRRVGTVGPGPHAAGKGFGVRRIKRRVRIRRRRRQTTAVDQRAREGLCTRQLEHGIAQAQRTAALWRDEVGGARGVADVVVGRDRRVPRGRCPASAMGASPSSTALSFQPRLSQSCTPVLAPRAPKGETWCAASPLKITRPWRKWSMRRQANWYTDTHSSSNSTSGPSMAWMRGITFSGFFSSTGSALQPSWKSMRQTLSHCLCSSTL